MRKENMKERYPRINIRMPIDLNKSLRKCFKKRGELSRALVIIIQEAMNENGIIEQVRATLLRQQTGGGTTGVLVKRKYVRRNMPK